MNHHEDLAGLFSSAVKVLLSVLEALRLVVKVLLRTRREPWKRAP